MHKRIFSFALLLTLLVSGFVPSSSFAQSQSEVPEFGTDAYEAYMEQFDEEVEAVNDSSPEVFVTNLSFDTSKQYAPGDAISGSFSLENTSGVDAPEVYYAISLLDGFDTETFNSNYTYGEVSSGPHFIKGNSGKSFSFEYVVPSFSPSGAVALHVQAYSSSGNLAGWDEKVITLANTPIKSLESSQARISVGDSLFGLQEGPNVLDGEVAYLTFAVQNSSAAPVSFVPTISFHDKQTSLPSILEQDFAAKTIAAGETKNIILTLPTFEYKPGVYAGSATFVGNNNVRVLPDLSFRYIMSNDFAAISSVSVDKDSVEKDESISVTVVYSGPAPSVNIAPTNRDEEASGVMTVTLTNKAGDVVATEERVVSLKDGNEYVQNFDLVASESAKQMFAEVTITRGGEVLVSYKTNLTDPDTKSSIAKVWWTIAILVLVIMGIFLLITRRKTASTIALLFVVAAASFALSPSTVDASASFKFASPNNNQIMAPGEQFLAKATYTYNSCANVSGSMSAYLKFEGSKSATKTSQINGNGKATPSKTYNAPMVPGRYKVEAFGNWTDTAHGLSGNNKDWVWIEVACPSGTTWNGSSCVAPPPSPVAGVCGSANGVAVSSAPGTNLCAPGSGAASSVTTNPTTYTWTCAGTNGGNPSPTCSAPRIINGVCGASNNACTAGNLSDTADTSTNYLWACNGSNGGTNASNCSLPKPVTNTLHVQSNVTGTLITSSASGLGGNTSYTKTSSLNISTTLTAPATASTGGSFTSWTGCDTTNPTARTCAVAVSAGGEKTVVANYAAPPAVVATCGTANGNTSFNFPASNLCASGNTVSNQVTSTTGAAHTWRCNNGTANTTCSAPRCASGQTYCAVTNSCLTNGTTCANPLIVTCSAPASVALNGSVSWSANTSGGASPYTYSWSGTDGLTGSTQSVNKTYSTTGTKSATVNVTSGSAQGSASCSTSVVNYASLTVQSSPAPGVVITSSNPTFGGTTGYAKVWTSNFTTVLTAPATNLSGTPFSSWTGCNPTGTSGRVCTISVNLGEQKLVTANYVTAPTISCGAADGNNSLSFPTPASSLCSSGSATNLQPSTTGTSHRWSCGTNSCSAPRCPSGQTFCANTNSCSTDPTCGGGNNSCKVLSNSDITYTLLPSIVEKPSDFCNIVSYGANYEGKGDVDPVTGAPVCAANAVTCTLNGGAVPDKVSPGTYTLACKGVDNVPRSRTFQCKVDPDYGEF